MREPDQAQRRRGVDEEIPAEADFRRTRGRPRHVGAECRLRRRRHASARRLQGRPLGAQRHQVLLWEAHSINDELPRLSEGVLPDLNFGTFAGKSAAALVNEALREIAGQSRYSWVLNGRFKRGYITRHYGDPGSHIHAVQLEMSQRIYMNEPEPFEYREDLAARVQPLLSQLLDASLAAAK